MVGSIARETGNAGLMVGGFYSVALASILCPPVGIGLITAGALWLYGQSKR